MDLDETERPQFELEPEEEVELEPEEEEELGAELCDDPECDCKVAGVSGVTEFDLEWDFSDWIQLSPLRDPECPEPPMSSGGLGLREGFATLRALSRRLTDGLRCGGGA